MTDKKNTDSIPTQNNESDTKLKKPRTSSSSFANSADYVGIIPLKNIKFS